MTDTAAIVEPLGSDPQHTTVATAPRPRALEGIRLGLLDNGKPNAAHVVATAARGLQQRHHLADVLALTKAVASRPAPEDVVREFTGFDAAIVGVGD